MKVNIGHVLFSSQSVEGNIFLLFKCLLSCEERTMQVSLSPFIRLSFFLILLFTIISHQMPHEYLSLFTQQLQGS